MGDRSILVAGPRELPDRGGVEVWIDAGSGPGFTRTVPAGLLSLAPADDGQSASAVYTLAKPGCRG